MIRFSTKCTGIGKVSASRVGVRAVLYTAYDLQLMSVFLMGDLWYGICRNRNL